MDPKCVWLGKHSCMFVWLVPARGKTLIRKSMEDQVKKGAHHVLNPLSCLTANCNILILLFCTPWLSVPWFWIPKITNCRLRTLVRWRLYWQGMPCSPEIKCWQPCGVSCHISVTDEVSKVLSGQALIPPPLQSTCLVLLKWISQKLLMMYMKCGGARVWKNHWGSMGDKENVSSSFSWNEQLFRNEQKQTFTSKKKTLQKFVYQWRALATMIYHSEPPVSLTVRRFARKFDLLGGAVKVEPSHELVESAGYNGGRMEVSNANIDPEDLSITSTLYFVLIFCSCLYSCSPFATLICSKMWFKSVFHGKQRVDMWTCEVVTGSESESVPSCQKSAKRCRQPWVFCESYNIDTSTIAGHF